MTLFTKTKNMIDKIAFVGGIHGVGKSTICKKICNELKYEFLSASELIKWNDINADLHNKKVTNIYATQDRLILGLANSVKKEKFYLLDGHYCLLNKENEILNIPIETFKLINPFSLNIILGDITEIKDRLEKRDNHSYDYELLKKMQESELEYAKFLSKNLGVNLNIGTQNDYAEMQKAFNDFMTSKK